MKLKCHRCGYEWEYNGKKKVLKKFTPYVSCSRCRTSVKLQETKDEPISN